IYRDAIQCRHVENGPPSTWARVGCRCGVGCVGVSGSPALRYSGSPPPPSLARLCCLLPVLTPKGLLISAQGCRALSSRATTLGPSRRLTVPLLYPNGVTYISPGLSRSFLPARLPWVRPAAEPTNPYPKGVTYISPGLSRSLFPARLPWVP